MKFIIALWILVMTWPVLADQGMTVIPKEPVFLNDVNFAGQATASARFVVNTRTECFGTNLRNVPNPLDPGASIIMELGFQRKDGLNGTVRVTWPALHSFEKDPPPGTKPVEYMAEMDPAGFDPGVKVAQLGHTITIRFSGVGSLGERLYDIESISFEQLREGYVDETTTTKDPKTGTVTTVTKKKKVDIKGSLKGDVTWAYSGDNTLLDINAAFPGIAGMCGSFYSPLMIFTSDKRPTLQKTVEFPLRPQGKRYYWPEGSKDWGFVAYDRNGNGKVDSGTELFGGDDKHKNGFEALRELDSNKDGQVDAKDKSFAKIQYWQDLNANGKTDKGELSSLKSKGVTSISLTYDDKSSTPFGERGALRETGKALTKKGEVAVIDVWFGVEQLAPIERKPAHEEPKKP